MDTTRFMGRMTATVSHDLCNVLATIQQASGLLGDYLALARKESLLSMGIRPKFKYDAKFADIIAQIAAQVNRGQDICEHLSALAHSPDEDQSGADMARASRLIAKLAGRVAKRHKVNLLVEEIPQTFLADVPLIDVLAALEAALLGVAWECGENRDLRLVPGEEGDSVHVDILCQDMVEGQAKSLAESLSEGNPGPFTAGAVQGGVRLAFPKAGRKA